jgi:hypothetical protein
MFKTVLLLAILNAYRKETMEKNGHPSIYIQPRDFWVGQGRGEMIRSLSSIVSKQSARLLNIAVKNISATAS